MGLHLKWAKRKPIFESEKRDRIITKIESYQLIFYVYKTKNGKKRTKGKLEPENSRKFGVEKSKKESAIEISRIKNLRWVEEGKLLFVG